MNSVMPCKTSVTQRNAAILAQHQQIRESKTALLVDPLLRLSECMGLLGSPSYTTVRSWIKSGSLRAVRPGGRGPYRCRLSEVERFLRTSEVRCG
jgi:excisionase family DNA binding protein